MHRNQAVAVQIHADRYTIIGDSILITPTDADVRRVKAHLAPNRDGDVAMQLTLMHPHRGPIDVTESAYGCNTPPSRFAGIVDDYITFWFGDQTGAHSEL
ncbi:hypothetical protein [Streptomyces sp. A1547]|uniref:hypothetical protein n=1 Tax=Streptomyces TaxID=1883 RepID=UPI00109E5540|nr:hypothetical protein [Streptomyces sp. A1547]THA31417.1 hypothetical protein E6W17_36050 [Streptomyces sp. A1547]